MKQIHCPHCKKLLFKAELADVEIVCNKCKRLVTIKFYTAKALVLTTSDKADSIEAVERLKN